MIRVSKIKVRTVIENLLDNNIYLYKTKYQFKHLYYMQSCFKKDIFGLKEWFETCKKCIYYIPDSIYCLNIYCKEEIELVATSNGYMYLCEFKKIYSKPYEYSPTKYFYDNSKWSLEKWKTKDGNEYSLLNTETLKEISLNTHTLVKKVTEISSKENNSNLNNIDCSCCDTKDTDMCDSNIDGLDEKNIKKTHSNFTKFLYKIVRNKNDF